MTTRPLLDVGPPVAPASAATWDDRRRATIERQGGRCARCHPGAKAPRKRPDGLARLDVVKLPEGALVALCRQHRLQHDAPDRVAKAVRTRRLGALQVALLPPGKRRRKTRVPTLLEQVRSEALTELGPGASAGQWVEAVLRALERRGLLPG